MSLRRPTKALIAAIAERDGAVPDEQEIRDRLGISTMSLMTDSDPQRGVDAAALVRAVAAGARKIEVGADFGPSHFPIGDERALERLSTWYTQHGAEIYSVHSPLARDPRAWDDDEVARLIDAMAIVKAKVLLLHYVFTVRDEWEAAMATMERLVERCAPHDIRLSIETDTDMSFDAGFADFFDFPRVGICCDTGHTGAFFGNLNVLAEAGNAVATMATAHHKLNHLHLSDVSIEPLPRPHATQTLKPRRDHWSPGLGCTNWTVLFQALHATDYPGCFMFEIWTEDERRFDNLATFPQRLAAGELGRGFPGAASPGGSDR